MTLRDIPKLPPKAEKVLTALLHHGAVRSAAKEAGVSEATVFRYLQDAEFQRRYRQARAGVVDAAIALMQRLCANAVSTLAAVMHDTDAPASARVSAARTILEQSMSAVELTGLRQEVEEIKQMLAEREGVTGATRARA
jgi:molybdenum-dependent DNA-binding transcriptional regulator ModE